MPTIELPNCYVSEKTPHGFVLCETGPFDTESMGHFARACVELGHRLAKEGKQIEEVRLSRDYNPFEGAKQTTVRVKIKHVLANDLLSEPMTNAPKKDGPSGLVTGNRLRSKNWLGLVYFLTHQKPMKTKTFQDGDLVWIYSGTTEPREGVVTQTRDYGWFVKDHLGEHLHAEGAIYARPSDGEYLAGVIEDDAQHMDWCAKRFRSALPNAPGEPRDL